MSNPITQLFSLTLEEKPLHSQTHQDMLCPLTGKVEPMRLQLYSQHICSYGIFKRIPRRPSARFFRIEDEQEIDAKYWTGEMRQAYDTAVRGNTPVVGSGVQVTTYGKVVIVFLLAAVSLLVYRAYSWSTAPAQDNQQVEVQSA